MGRAGINGAIVVLLVTSSIAFARKCWHCENARSNWLCLTEGKLEYCLPNQRYCQNEIRGIAGGKYYEITKRCKQTNACDNNKMQNTTGYYPYQCDTSTTHSVCRCCCGFDNCNGPEVACATVPPTCDAPPRVANGSAVCPRHLAIDSYCHFKCQPGYKLIGNRTTQCVSGGKTAHWDKEAPTCIRQPCSALTAPNRGSMSCTNEWEIGSVCSFSCDPGLSLIGQRFLTCSSFSKWSDPTPKCDVIRCPAPRRLDPNFVPRQGVCTDAYNLDSVCTFTCKDDFELVGDQDITCGPPAVGRNSVGSWDKKPPRCRPIRCYPRYCPGNKVGEACERSCGRCERIVGRSAVRCTRSGWLPRALGNCAPVFCELTLRAPENGRIECTHNDGACDSSCRFFCDSSEFKVVGDSVVTCLGTGQWSGITPKCEREICIPRYCPTNKVGEGCTTSCARCESLVGAGTSNCTEDGWSNPPGECVQVTCNARLLAPENGTIECTPNDGACDSSCRFFCDAGFKVVGDRVVTCLETGQWSGITPKCEREFCIPRYCPTNKIGEECTTRCARCESLVGAGTSNCTKDGWSNPPGECVQVTCNARRLPPLNGAIDCDSTQCDGVCTYSCNDGYKLTGNAEVTCLPSGRWSGAPPICEDDECDPFTIPGATKDCSNGDKVGSQCKIECSNPNQVLVGDETVTCVKSGSDSEPRWEPEITQRCESVCAPYRIRNQIIAGVRVSSVECSPPAGGARTNDLNATCSLSCIDGYRPNLGEDTARCFDLGFTALWDVDDLCCVECTENLNVDIFAYIDKTEPQFWDDRIEFLRNLFQFMVSPSRGYTLRVKITPFGRTVDNNPNVLTTDYNSILDGLVGVTRRARQPSNSGETLEQVYNIIKDAYFDLTEPSAPFVFLLTTKNPNDETKAQSAIDELVRRKIPIRIYPVTGPDTAETEGIFFNDKEGIFVFNRDGPGEQDMSVYGEQDLIVATKEYCRKDADDGCVGFVG